MTAFLHRPAIRRLAAALGLAAGVVVLAAGPAGAHIHTDPEQAPAGSTTTVGFEVEHGCEGSPTVEVSIEIPQGVNDASAQPLPGWSSSVESGVARWTGGSLPDDSPGVFPLRMTLPEPARTAAVQDDPALRRGVARLDRGHRRRPARTRAPCADPRGHRRRPGASTTTPPEPATTQPPPTDGAVDDRPGPVDHHDPARRGRVTAPTTTAARSRTCSAGSPRSS